MSTPTRDAAREISVDYVLDAIRAYSASENPSSFLAVNEGNSYFTLPGRPGVVVYRPAGHHLIQFGGPFAPDESYEDLLLGFRAFAESQGRTVSSIQLQERDARVYARHGFTVNQVGASYAVDLNTFTLAGSRYMQLRNKISRALRSGLTIVEADYEQWAHGVREIDRLWLPIKGESARPLEYLVGQTGGDMQKHRRLFVGHIDGELIGYVSYSPVYGSNPGWMHDLSRRRPDSPAGVMEAINKAAIDVFRGEDVPWLHFGFTPFTSLSDDREVEGHSLGFKWLMHYLWENQIVYPASSQLSYKEKWNQSLVLTEYAAFTGKASIDGFVNVWRAANAM
ncbi:phosphatidylglycerol lysyltransferase domain-containing protein [Streptomyces sp. NPDC053048]|uniref:phosphatidylglycerol lysyltransferase domain-containing protein n=1 Tax=Streptomyces sp. NPDC053048 TaxID=3365694 RepID=UPI0037D54E0E